MIENELQDGLFPEPLHMLAELLEVVITEWEVGHCWSVIFDGSLRKNLPAKVLVLEPLGLDGLLLKFTNQVLCHFSGDCLLSAGLDDGVPCRLEEVGQSLHLFLFLVLLWHLMLLCLNRFVLCLKLLSSLLLIGKFSRYPCEFLTNCFRIVITLIRNQHIMLVWVLWRHRSEWSFAVVMSSEVSGWITLTSVPLARAKSAVNVAFCVCICLSKVNDWRLFLYQIVEFSVKNGIKLNKT